MTMNVILARFGLGDPGWLDPVSVVVGILATLVAAVIFHKLLFPLVVRIAGRTSTDLDNRLLYAIRMPLTFGVVVLGVYVSITLLLDLDSEYQAWVDRVIGLLGIVMAVMMVVALASNAIDWYLENLAARTQHVVDLKLFPLLKRVSVVVIYGMGGLLVLDLLNINISPLIAALGLGGLAVALALQPTLANLFAGTYVMTEGVIAPEDYVSLEGGITGYVVEVGWRSTRIRTWENNLVVVPNNRFAETIITNYQQPVSAVNVYLLCGVSYDSDLRRVEQVCQEVMDEVLDTVPQAVREYGSYFGYESFGDSNVNFWLFLQAKTRLDSFIVQTELMKLLHARLGEEDITINYPVRTLQFPKEWGPEQAPLRDGGGRAKRFSRKNLRRRARRSRPGKGTDVDSDSGGDGGAGDAPF